MITDKQADAALMAIELEDTIAAFIARPRAHPVRQNAISNHVRRFPMFVKTTPAAMENAMECLVAEGLIRIVALSLRSFRQHNGAYGYEA